MDVSPEELEARIHQAALAFDALPPKPPKPSSPRRQIVVTLFDEITRLKQNGYHFDEICQLLVEQTEIEMTPGTLRKYWGAEQRQRQGKKPQRKRSGKSQRRKKQPLHAQVLEEPVKADEVDQADQDSPETAVAINPVTSDNSKPWPPEDRETSLPPESEAEHPVEHHDLESKTDDDDDWSRWNKEDDDDS